MSSLTNILKLSLFCHLLAASVSATRLQNVEPKQGQEHDDDAVTERIARINHGRHLDLFEGDIFLTDEDRPKVDTSDDGDVDSEPFAAHAHVKRNVMRDRQGLWARREIPYEFHPSLPVSYRITIMTAIDEFHLKTCLKFRPKTKDSNWIVFIHKQGCWSTVGRKFWRVNHAQEVSLGPGCNAKATVIHELMHAAGFWHEHSRTDRNKYVEVLWENILEDQGHNFNKYKHDMMDQLQVPYDYDSIMHYGRKQFSKNGQDTIRALRNPNRPMGQSVDLSPTDIREINTVYDCKNNVPGWSSWSDFGPCNLYCKKKRQRYCFSDHPAVDCPGNHPYNVEAEEVVCNNAECYAAIAGHFGRWSSWSNCSTPCAPGSRTRTRTCDDPPPKYGGANCTGNWTQTGACNLRRCGLGPDDCEFDNDKFCFWKNDPKSNFDWLRGSGATPSKDTGPTADHSSGNGHYVYIESSSPAQPGYKARLISKRFRATPGRCLSFWYHMQGSSIGELNVYLQTTTYGLKRLWHRSREQGNRWLHALVSLVSGTEYELVFEAVRGNSFNGDIAIDDIKFEEKLCGVQPVGCFKDGVPHAFPGIIANLRDDIDWYHMDKTINECARLARLKEYKMIGIQFYGECWSGNSSLVVHDAYGHADSSQCWSGVGGSGAYYVYRLP